MQYISRGRVIEIQTDPKGTADSDAIRQAAGIPSDRVMIVRMSDGSNRQVNPGERLLLTPGQEVVDLAVHERGFREPGFFVRPVSSKK
jgi:hypothetical protein